MIIIISFLAGSFWKEFQYTDICLDMGGSKNPGNYPICVISENIYQDYSDDSDIEGETKVHYTWDMNEDGVNDCEDNHTCDDSVDYTLPRYKIEGIEDNIVFDKKSGKWVDKYGICHTCTPQNGFKKDGTMDETMFEK
jgi:hypothetical protein